MYSGPRKYMLSALRGCGSEEIIQKSCLVFVAAILSEESDIRPLEEGHKVTLVEDMGEETKHEFDTVTESMNFAKVQQDPDKSPLEITVLEFQNDAWHKVHAG